MPVLIISQGACGIFGNAWSETEAWLSLILIVSLVTAASPSLPDS